MNYDDIADYVRDEISPILAQNGIKLDQLGTQLKFHLLNGAVLIPLIINGGPLFTSMAPTEFLIVYPNEDKTDILEHVHLLIELIHKRLKIPSIKKPSVVSGTRRIRKTIP